MKVVVLGGGVAGLCIAIYLHQHNFEVCINDKQNSSAIGSHVFLMHHDGIAVLKELACASGFELPGKPVDAYILRNTEAELLTEESLQNWQCFKRTDLLKYLISLLPAAVPRNNRIFKKFVYRNDRIIAAEFSNGELEYGDIFIGADGADSVVREQVFGEIKFEPGRIKEVAGIVQHPQLARSLKNRFTKIQQRDRGLSFGMIPASDTELVWFMQYNPLIADVTENNAAQLKSLCETLLKDFPVEVTTVLSANDFGTSYSWHTRDFDLLPTFHHQNVVLIGDSAHVALPFTSAGTTNALMDAQVLTASLRTYPDYYTAFKAYYKSRAVNIAAHIHLGRQLRNSFLDPAVEFSIPLINNGIFA